MDKISPIKERILQFIDYKGITKELFCKNTGISTSNLKGKSLFSEIGGSKIAEILSIYGEISPAWLLTGEGEMLRQENEKELHYVNTTQTVNEPPINYGSKKCDLCKEKDNQIEDLKERILSQEQTIRILLSKIPDD